VQAEVIRLVGLKNGGRLSPINLVTVAGTQNGEYLPSLLDHWFKTATLVFGGLQCFIVL
jgi:hypothetical protein